MSAEAMTYVWKNSPYKNTNRLIHVAIADIANDEHDNRLFCSQSSIAAKCNCDRKTVTRAFEQMVTDGFLTLITDNSRNNKPNVYEFMMPQTGGTNRPEPWDTITRGGTNRPVGGTSRPAEVGHLVPEGGAKSPTNSIELKSTTQENSSTPASAIADADDGTLFAAPVTEPSKAKTVEEYTPEFEEAWKIYPLLKGKKRAFQCFNARRKEGWSAEDLTRAAANYAKHCRQKRTEKMYMKHGEGFWGKSGYFEDWLEGEGGTVNLPSDRYTDRNIDNQGVVDRDDVKKSIEDADTQDRSGTSRALTREEIQAMIKGNRGNT